MWVVEYTNDRIQRLTSGGTYLSKLGVAGLAVNEFESPQGIAVSPNGRILVADTLNNRVQVFLDANGPDTLFDAGGPGSISSSTSATFNFHANEPGSTFECKLDSNPYRGVFVRGAPSTHWQKGPTRSPSEPPTP